MRHTRSWISLTAVAVACAQSESATSNGPSPTTLDGGAAGSPPAVDASLGCVPDDPAHGDVCGPGRECHQGVCVPACEAASKARGSMGCEFLVPTPPTRSNGPDGMLAPCHAAVIANGSSQNMLINVERGDESFDATSFARLFASTASIGDWPPLPSTGLPPGEVAVLFLSHHPDSNYQGVQLRCPVWPAMTEPASIDGSGKSLAWRITTSMPATSYDVLPWGGAKSYLPGASLLLPTASWGSEYVAQSPPRARLLSGMWSLSPPLAIGVGPFGPLHLLITAGQDGASVTVTPSADLEAGPGLPSTATSSPLSIVLGANEYVQLESAEDVSGSVIVADRPVALTVNNSMMAIETQTSAGACCADATHVQNTPAQALGHDYVAAPHRSRRQDQLPESIVYRLFGVRDGTLLSYDPPLPDAPTTLGLGEVMDFETTHAFSVKSQDPEHPFALSQLMSGGTIEDIGLIPGVCDEFSPAGDSPPVLGDADLAPMLPPAQFLERYVFWTDPTFGTVSLSLVRFKGEEGFAPVHVDCLGEVGGWKPVGSTGLYEVTTVDLVFDWIGQGTCTNGLQVAESAQPFGLTVWGMDCAASYAYPAGGSFMAINSVEIEPPK